MGNTQRVGTFLAPPGTFTFQAPGEEFRVVLSIGPTTDVTVERAFDVQRINVGLRLSHNLARAMVDFLTERLPPEQTGK